MPIVSTDTSPQAAVSAAENILAEPALVPESYPDSLDLPGGWRDGQGTVHHNAIVREMTGSDEEEIGRANDVERFLNTIVNRATVSIGGIEATPAMIGQLYVGDRDALLLAIRIATYGPDYETEILCPLCQFRFSMVIEINQDIPSHRLSPNAPLYEQVHLRDGRIAEVRLACVNDQTAILNDKDLSTSGAAQNTRLLSRCVRSIDGEPVLGDQTFRIMGAGDRRALIKFITTNAPGPRMSEVMVPCSKCNQSSELALSMPALFL